MGTTSSLQAQFRQIARWIFWLCLTFGGVMLAAGLRLADPRLALMAMILLGHATVTCTLVARARVHSLERAGLIMSVATLLSILACTFVAPTFGVPLVVATTIPAALALQHGRRLRAQRWLLALCWLSAIFIGIVAELHTPAAGAGAWVDRAFRLAGIACADGILLLLVWQAARRTWDHAAAEEQAQQDALIAEARLRESETALQQAIEERARLLGQLRDAQQLAVLGRLVGGVAQDFNNHLTSLVGYTELLLWELTEESGKRQDLLEIRRAAERATVLTQQLQAFSHIAPPRPVVLNLADVIMNSVRIVRRLLGPDVRIVTALAREASLLRADPTLIGYVLLNLGAQAREAMPDGGTLTIETTQLDVDVYAKTHSDLRSDSVPQPGMPQPGMPQTGVSHAGAPQPSASGGDLPSGFVRLTVSAARRSDWPPATRDAARRATCDAASGATRDAQPPALGIAAVEDIVRDSGGSVIATQDLAGNRTTTIYLPRVLDAESAAIVETVAPRGTEAVLVVESESVVRDYVRTLLERHGYHAVVADGPREACSQARSARPPVDLAIVNLVLPDDGPEQLVQTLIGVRPGIRLLYMTHHLASARGDLLRMPRGGFVIEKPFKPNEFLIAVRQALDSLPSLSTRV